MNKRTVGALAGFADQSTREGGKSVELVTTSAFEPGSLLLNRGSEKGVMARVVRRS